MGAFKGRDKRRKFAAGVGDPAGAAHVWGADDERSVGLAPPGRKEVGTAALGSLRAGEQL